MRFTERDQGGAPSVGQHPHQTGPASFRNLAQGSCEGADAEEASEAMYFEELFGEDWPPAAPAPTEMSWLEQPTHEAPASTSVVADLVFRCAALLPTYRSLGLPARADVRFPAAPPSKGSLLDRLLRGRSSKRRRVTRGICDRGKVGSHA